jgi:capsular polysaccharide biosynthesis protein
VASASNVQVKHVLDVARFEAPKPPRLAWDGPLPREFAFDHLSGYPVAVHRVQDGKMFVGHARSTLMLDEQRYFEGVSSAASNWIAPAFAAAAADLPLKGTVAVLFADGASLYGHWMFDLLPKIDVLRRAGWADRDIDHYAVNATNANFSTESLSRLGIASKKVVQVSGCVVSGNILLVPSRVRRRFRAPDWAREFVVSLFLPRDEGDSRAGTRERIYISRANARRRRILNEAEVGSLLDSRGFRTVFAEQMKIAELAPLVRRAALVVAPHGAGITNVAFARSGIGVLELFGAHIAVEGWLMTAAVGGRHHLLAGRNGSGERSYEEAERNSAARLARNEADYLVDTNELSHAIDVMESA